MNLSEFRNALEDAVAEYDRKLIADGFVRRTQGFIGLSTGFRDGVTKALRIAEREGGLSR